MLVVAILLFSVFERAFFVCEGRGDDETHSEWLAATSMALSFCYLILGVSLSGLYPLAGAREKGRC